MANDETIFSIKYFLYYKNLSAWILDDVRWDTKWFDCLPSVGKVG